jgi:hypothetical protein
MGKLFAMPCKVVKLTALKGKRRSIDSGETLLLSSNRTCSPDSTSSMAMLRRQPFCARDVPHEAWPPPPHGKLRGGGDLAPCGRGELPSDGCLLRDALPLHDDASRHVRGAGLLCDGALLLPWTCSFLLPEDLQAPRDCGLAVKGMKDL